jgi:hypothetical protein
VIVLPRWYRPHRRALTEPLDVRATAGWVRLQGEARLSQDKIKQMVWQRWRRWPTVLQPYIHRENINIMGIQITWTPPTTRLDGSAADAADYQSVIIAEVGTVHEYTDIATLPGDQLSHLLVSVPTGTHTYTVRYVDTRGQQGAHSAEVTVAVPEPLPSPLAAPTGVEAIVL